VVVSPSDGSSVKAALFGLKSRAVIETLSPSKRLSSPISALLLSSTIFTAIPAPTAVRSPLPLPLHWPGLSQVASEATAAAQARVTILLVASDVTDVDPSASKTTSAPTIADCSSSE